MTYKIYYLREGETIVGRSTENMLHTDEASELVHAHHHCEGTPDIVLNGLNIASMHCRIVYENGEVYISPPNILMDPSHSFVSFSFQFSIYFFCFSYFSTSLRL